MSDRAGNHRDNKSETSELIERMQCYGCDEVEAENDRLKAINAELLATIERGGWDVSPCMVCNLDVVCLPDGLPMCESCAKRENDPQPEKEETK